MMMKIFPNIHPAVSLSAEISISAVLLFDVAVAHTYFPKKQYINDICACILNMYTFWIVCTLHKVIVQYGNGSEYRRQREPEFTVNVCNYPNVVSQSFELIANVNIECLNEEKKLKKGKEKEER